MTMMCKVHNKPLQDGFCEDCQGAVSLSPSTSLLACDGSCDEHVGTVRPVECWGPNDPEPWRFNYCDEAIAEDTRRGFRVVEV